MIKRGFFKLSNKMFDLDQLQPPKDIKYKVITKLQDYPEPPKNVKLKARDFIHDCLYNKNYGYFSKQAVIMSTLQNLDFNHIKDNLSFLNKLHDLYNEGKDELNYVNDVARQIWHTPTELFRPYYGYVVANYISKQAEIHHYKEINIYEIGGGNGTLMINILDYLRKNNPQLYTNSNYKIVEISQKLAKKQNETMLNSVKIDRDHYNVELINKSIFDLNLKETVNTEVPTFFIMMEVLDNFAHDVIRYDFHRENFEETIVTVDNKGRYYEEYIPLSDELISEYIKLSEINKKHKTTGSKLTREYASSLLFKTKIKEFIPTKQLELLKELKKTFHQPNLTKNLKLIINDFYYLDKQHSVDGINAPVVQTRYGEKMVTTQSYMVRPGYFDIFFPTDFENMNLIIKKLFPGLNPKIYKQKEFIQEYGLPEILRKTRLKSRENPMLEYYENCKFLTT